MKLLESAYLIMVEKQTIPTMREIAARAEMGLGSVYYHFKGLDQIFIELDHISYEHIMSVIKQKAADLNDPLMLFMAVETFRSLYCLSWEIYIKLLKTMPLDAHFSKKRIDSIDKLLDPLWERSDDYDIYHYLGLYMAFFVKMTSPAQSKMEDNSIYDGMERLFFSFFEDSLDLWDVSDSFRKVKELGRGILHNELALPWTNSDVNRV